MVVWVVVGYVCLRCLLDLGLYICGGLVWFLRLVVVAFWYGLLMDACGLAGVAGGVFVFTFCLALLCCIETLVLLGWIVAFGVNWLWRLCGYDVVGVVGWFVWLQGSAVVLCLVVAECRSGFA